MKSLDYLEDIKNKHNLSNDEVIDILEHIGYIARDNAMDDTVTEVLIDVLQEGL